MIQIQPMSESRFNEFRGFSQKNFAKDFATVQGASFAEALKNASEQFERLVPNGLKTQGQLFFDVVEESTGRCVGYLWLGIKENLGRKVISINDIFLSAEVRGRGYGKTLMNLVAVEAKKAGAVQVRLHVFANNHAALGLYENTGFQVSSLDMFKPIT